MRPAACWRPSGSGARSHRSSALPRSGKAGPSRRSRRPTRSRFADEARTASRRATPTGATPSLSLAIVRPSRALTSRRRSISSAEAISDFTSTTSRSREDGWSARRSTDPRSPKWLKLTSGVTTHPCVDRRCETAEAVDACRSSRSRSSHPPRCRTPISMSASTASNTRQSVRTDIASQRPSSICETVDCETPATVATSDCRSERARRRTRSARPTRRRSIAPAWSPTVTS